MTRHRYSKREESTRLHFMHALRPPERQKCSVYVQKYCVDSPFQDTEESWLPCALHQAKTTRKGNHFSHTTATDFVWVCVHLSRQGHLLVVTTWRSRRRNPQSLVQESVWQSHSVHMQCLEGRHATLGALSD